MPQSTDLVTDLPADFEVFGQAVATSMADLLGGTSGQILAKNSNTDMDFVWTTPNPGDITGVTAGVGISGGGTSGDVTVTNSMATAIDAKGDLIAGTAADTFSRLAVGTNGQTLVADSSTATGLKWATPAGGGKVLQVVYGSTTTQTTNATTTFADTTLSATITPSATSSKILVLVSQNGVLSTTAATGVKLRLLRGATTIVTFSGSLGYNSTTTTRNDLAGSVSYLDSPSTTSATTYKTQFAQRTSDATAVQVQVTGGDDTSTMILLEIGA